LKIEIDQLNISYGVAENAKIH